MPNQLKVQNQYRTYLTTSGGIISTWDITFTVTSAPAYTNGYLVFSPDIVSQREIMYYHNVTGNIVSVRAENRGLWGTIAKTHAENEAIQINDIAEIFNTFSDMISQAFYVEKTGGLNIKVWWGYVVYNGNQQLITDTTLWLANNTTNYIKYDFISNAITADTSNTGNIKAVIVTALWAITSISYRSHKESFQSLVPGAGDMRASLYDPSSKVKPVAFNDEVVHLTWNETIGGVKTLTSNANIWNDGQTLSLTGTTHSFLAWLVWWVRKFYMGMAAAGLTELTIRNEIPSGDISIGTTGWNIYLDGKLVWNPDFYQYSIVRTVASWNLTVALKNYEGNDPTPTKPVKIMIGGVLRTITSALSKTRGTWANFMNLWSAELATKEVDLFTYIGWQAVTSSPRIYMSRYPAWNIISDFSNDWVNEKYLDDYVANWTPTATDPVVNIGRFNATLSAGAGYTWSIPATSVIINSPIYETRWLDWIPTYSCSWSMTYTPTINHTRKYKIQWASLVYGLYTEGTTWGTASIQINATLPFTPAWQFKAWWAIYDNPMRTWQATVVWNQITFLKSDSSNWGIWTIKEIWVSMEVNI